MYYTDEDKLTYGQRNKGEIHLGKVVAVTACVGTLLQTETTVLKKRKEKLRLLQ